MNYVNKDIIGIPVWQWGIVILALVTIFGFGDGRKILSDEAFVNVDNLEGVVIPKDGFD